MEYEFDKEIDSLLRQARPETTISEEFSAHVDANEISLFTENALTQKARTRVTKHLADCTKCRKILSSVIALNAEDTSENLHTKEKFTVITETGTPWYRKLFAFPQLAYTMGGLTVLLAGMIGYVVLQSYNELNSASVAQVEKSVERPQGASEASSDGETGTIEQYSTNAANVASNASNSTASAANAAANIAAKPSLPVSNANSNAAISSVPKDQASTVQPAPAPATANNLAEREARSEDKKTNDETAFSVDGAERAGGQTTYQQNSVARNQVVTPDSRNVQSRRVQNVPMETRAPMVAAQAAPPENDDEPKPAKKESGEKAKSVNGKAFVYKDNVWYDKSYKQQKTTNVSRNSADYKKLDSGLRSIADNLSGIVVIVWNGKAYRIQ